MFSLTYSLNFKQQETATYSIDLYLKQLHRLKAQLDLAPYLRVVCPSSCLVFEIEIRSEKIIDRYVPF